MRSANDAARFALELCLLAAVAYGGWSIADGVLGWLLAVAAPAAVAIVWGVFVSPKAPRRVSTEPWRLLLEIVLFGCGVAALAIAGAEWLAAAFAVAVAVHLALTFVLAQR
jgi:hypothetical protein